MYECVNQILKKESPVTEEEKLLLEVITSDATTIATTLQKLLHCGKDHFVTQIMHTNVNYTTYRGRNRLTQLCCNLQLCDLYFSTGDMSVYNLTLKKK